MIILIKIELPISIIIVILITTNDRIHYCEYIIQNPIENKINQNGAKVVHAR